jgi:hypothetical protein
MVEKRPFLPRPVSGRDLALLVTGVSTLMMVVLVAIGLLLELWPGWTPTVVVSPPPTSSLITDVVKSEVELTSTEEERRKEASEIATRLALPHEYSED